MVFTASYSFVANSMTAQEILSLRKAGHIEEAYEAARQLYASDKGDEASQAMLCTASDVLQKRIEEGRHEEARKIRLALDRLKSRMESTNVNKPNHIELGKWGEELAVAYLRDKGYAILERDWHSAHRDIDIIAQDQDCLVFIEVKARQNRMFAEPESAVNYHKLKNLRLAINHYIKYRKVDNPWRFDVITVVGMLGGTKPEIQHIQDFQII